jgi:hypothetical protein
MAGTSPAPAPGTLPAMILQAVLDLSSAPAQTCSRSRMDVIKTFRPESAAYVYTSKFVVQPFPSRTPAFLHRFTEEIS